MTEEIKNVSDNSAANKDKALAAENSNQEAVKQPEDDRLFIERELEQYRAALSRSWEAAYKRYGLVLFHSLNPEEKVKIMNNLGFEALDARDYYNLAVIAIDKEDYAAAEKLLDKALDIEPEHAESLFNMALLLEKTDRKIQAIEYWEQYLELIGDEEEIGKIAEHLEEIAN